MNSTIRQADARDTEQIIAVCEQESHRHESYRDPFYAAGSHHREWLRSSVERLLKSQGTIALLSASEHGIDALLIGRLMSAPPVYELGGKVCLVEHFAATDETYWRTSSPTLIQEAEHRVKVDGGVLLCFECRRKEGDKRSLLQSLGYAVATDWYYCPLVRSAHSTEREEQIQEALFQDLQEVVDLFEGARERYQKYQPVLWRKAKHSAESQLEYLKSLQNTKDHLILIHREKERVNGALVMDLRGGAPPYELRGPWCSVDDFSVSRDQWSSIGAALLASAIHRAVGMGAGFAQVICPHGEGAKSSMLAKMGYRVGHEWLVKKV